MARKVILDVDPGIDDAVALVMALFDPRLEVLAVTAAGGNVDPDQATRNVHAILDQVDPPRRPRMGAASQPSDGLPTDARHIFGEDGLGNANFPVVELHQRHASERVIIDCVRAHPHEVTIVALAPLTNVAKAFLRDPELPSLVHELIIMGGTVSGPGNVTPAAEFNIFSDPQSARAVFRSPAPKTLVPLDVTSQLVWSYDLLQELPDDTTRVGRFLHQIVPPLFRTHRQVLGQEGIHLHDAVALLCATDRGLFETHPMAGDVETHGQLAQGATIFDRRPITSQRPNIDVATTLDLPAAHDCILRALLQAARTVAE